MEQTQLKHALRLHAMAYEILLWINRQAISHRWLLSDTTLEQMRFGDTCENWLQGIRDQLPPTAVGG